MALVVDPMAKEVLVVDLIVVDLIVENWKITLFSKQKQ